MFDLAGSELLLVAFIALIVLGPERLPKAARFIGLWVRRARAQWYSVKGELERELAAEELQRSLRDGRDALRDVEASIRDTDNEMRREFDALRGDVERNGEHSVERDSTDTTSAVDANAMPDDDARPALETAETSEATAQEPTHVGR